MDRLALIGVSHRRGGAAALETFQSTFNPETLAGLGHFGFREWVPIVTCNRWDLALVLPEGMTVDEARRRLTPPGEKVRPYAYLGDGALEQITRIASSLDSLNPGEDQIMAQVREAFASAQASGSTGAVTSFAFNAALRVAKAVRREVALAPVNTSLFSLARPVLERFLPQSASVAVLGAGEMGKLAARTMACRPHTQLVVANRSLERAEALAFEVGAVALTLEDFLASPPDVHALVCATPVKDLVDEALLARLPNLCALVDMGLPRNISSEAAARFNIPVLDVDTLQMYGHERREELSQRLAQAEAVMLRELEATLIEWTERQLGPAIKRLREMYLETIGDSLPPEEAAKLAHKFAHVPIKGLRAVAREHGLEAARTFLAETGLV